MKLTRIVLGAAFLATISLQACKNLNYKKTKDGLLYAVKGEGKGDKIKAGNVIRIHLTDRLGDSLLGTSYGNPPQTVPIPVNGPNMDVFSIFFDAHKGDSILILQPIDSILAKNPMAAAKDSFLLANKGKTIVRTIKIVDVFKDQESMSAGQKKQDEAAIEKFLKEKAIQTTRTPQGVYVQVLTPGNGVLPKPGQEVSLRYTGKLLNGKMFDSNVLPTPRELLPVTIGAGGVIPGFEDAVANLSKGEKANVYIPSSLGYGSQAPPAIGPDQNLWFELEVVDIKDKAAPPPPTAMNGAVDSVKKTMRSK